MDNSIDRTRFNEALESLVEYAGANAGHVTTEDIALYFKEFFSEQSQYQAVYDYLKASHIAIEDMPGYDVVKKTDPDAVDPSSSNDNSATGQGQSVDDNFIDDSEYRKTAKADAEDESSQKTFDKPLESTEELEIIQMYENEIGGINELDASRKEALILRAQTGDSKAYEEITLSYLPLVRKIANEYAGQVVSLGDLIQEGNLGLVVAISQYDGNPQDFDSYVSHSVRASMQALCSEQTHSNRISDHLAGRMNRLDDISKELTTKLGHAPSVKELSEEMNLSEDEVDTIIRTSLNVLTVNAAKGSEDEDAK